MIKHYEAKCPKGHQHVAKPMRPEELPTHCRFFDCTEGLEWKAVGR